jgi:hypothetical protein
MVAPPRPMAPATGLTPQEERRLDEGRRAAEFFQRHRVRYEVERAERRLIAIGVGLVISVLILVVVLIARSRRK